MEGTQIGSYQIERRLGQGGFGVVYVGIDTRLGRRAAIKQLLPQLSTDRGIVERFFNEAKAAANINHAGIVEIYDVGWHTDGSAYFAMKLLDGDSLATRLRSVGPFSIQLAATIARQISSALVAAHARGIVHRDLKPDNIILVPDDEVAINERATVLDFGIAKLFSDNSVSHKTATGMMMGTPLYMSPEQCRGAGEVDHRTDVYALGCILFEMLTGRTPFVGEGAGEILGKHQFVDPPSLRSSRPDVPAELEAIVARTLAKDADRRYAQMSDLQAALQPFAAAGGRSREQPAVSSVPVNGVVPTVRSVHELVPVAVGSPQPVDVNDHRSHDPQPSSPPAKRQLGAWIAVGCGVVVVGAAIAAFTLRSRSVTTNSPADAPPPDDVTITIYGGRAIKIPAAAKPVPGKEGQHAYRLPWDSTLVVHDIDQAAAGGCLDALKRSEERWRAEGAERRQLRFDKLEQQIVGGRPVLYAELGTRTAEEADAGGEFHPIRAVSLCYGDHMVGVSVSARAALTDKDDALFRAIMTTMTQ